MLEYEARQAGKKYRRARWQLVLLAVATAVLMAEFVCAWYSPDILGSTVTSVGVAFATFGAALASLWASRVPNPTDDEEPVGSALVRLFGAWVMWAGLAMALLDAQVARWSNWTCAGIVVARYLVVVV